MSLNYTFCKRINLDSLITSRENNTNITTKNTIQTIYLQTLCVIIYKIDKLLHLSPRLRRHARQSDLISCENLTTWGE